MWTLFAIENLAIPDFTPITTFLTSICVCKILCEYAVLIRLLEFYIFCQDRTLPFLFFFKYNIFWVANAALNTKIFLLQHLKCWHYRYITSHIDSIYHFEPTKSFV